MGIALILIRGAVAFQSGQMKVLHKTATDIGVGGHHLSPAEWKSKQDWAAKITMTNPHAAFEVCSALVYGGLLLTSAQCSYGFENCTWSAVTHAGAQTVFLRATHPLYMTDLERTYWYDFALYYLSLPLERSPRLRLSTKRACRGNKVQLAGMGYWPWDPNSWGVGMSEPVVSDVMKVEDCPDEAKYAMCTVASEKGPCLMDRGGGFFKQGKKTDVVLGILSFEFSRDNPWVVPNCGDPSMRAGWNNVGPPKGWIDSLTLGDNFWWVDKNTPE